MQRFKLNIANSVVTQQNAGLSSMDTGFVLDLFKRTTGEGENVEVAIEAAQAIVTESVVIIPIFSPQFLPITN